MTDRLVEPPRPPAPRPRDVPLGTLATMRVLRRNPIETWTKAHFEWPILVGPTILGTIAVVNDPAPIRRVLVDNAANYRKDALQKRVLGPGLSEGLLEAEGDDWRVQRRAPVHAQDGKFLRPRDHRLRGRPRRGCGCARGGSSTFSKKWRG
jgi:hypothetical protein